MLYKLFTSRLIAFAALAIIMVFTIGGGSLIAQSVTEGYASDEPLQRGMLVAVKKEDSKKVEAITSESLDRLKGVVIQPSDSPVTLSSENEKVFVATSGTYEVLISDQNGSIEPGDYISISPLAGIGMKASENQSLVLGRAVTAFKGEGDSIGSTPATGNDKKLVNFGRIQVNISINRNPLLKLPDNPKVPKLLEKISESIANKPLSPSRIYIATAVFFVAGLISGIMLYSGARSSLISIGRNPFSKKVILRGLVQVVILSLIVFIIGIFGVYLLLKL